MDLIILGVDGVDPTYLDEVLEERNLEGFNELKEEAYYSDLDSTMPAITIPAWQVIFSGKDPGELSAYHIAQNNLKKKEKESPDSNNFYGEFFWDNIEREVAIHNVPGTFPSYPVEGSLRAGFPSSKDFDIYPQSLKEEVQQQFESKKDPHSKITSKAKIEAEMENFEIENKIRKKMIENGDPEILVSVVKMTDDVSHFSEEESQLKDGYEAVDKLVREMKELAEEKDANLIILSDHGFAEYRKKFNALQFLRRENLIKLVEEESSGSRTYDIINPLLDTPLKKYLKYLHDFLVKSTGKDLVGRSNILEDIDWQKSKLVPVFASDRDFGLKINPHTEIDNKEKLLEETCRKLRADNNIKEVHRSEDIYTENRKNPDILVRTVKGVLASTSKSNKLVSKTKTFAHDETGIFFAKGPDINEESSAEIDIYEITPTIYELIDEGPPEQLKSEPNFDILN